MWILIGDPITMPRYHGVNLQGSDVSGLVYGYGTNQSYCKHLPGYDGLPTESTTGHALTPES